jgi:glycosyltransferase involved in cell wall biosynthesis
VKNKRIIFINQYTGQLFIDIVNAFSEQVQCILFAGQVEPANASLSKNVKEHLFTRYNRNKALARIYTWGMFTVRAFLQLLISGKDNDLFIVSNPPFAPFLGYVFKKLRGTRYHLLIYDVYPDALVQFGIVEKNGVVDKLWSRCNKHLYRNAENIYTLSDNMAKRIKEYFPEAVVNVIPNWTDTSYIRPVNKKVNDFAIKYGQEGKITIMYSGNMGATHAVERIAVLAGKLKNHLSFSFIAIGNGVKRKAIEMIQKEQQLTNLLILPYQPPEELPLSLACADIGIVTLSSGAEDLSVPSKTYNLLAAGVALLVIASSTSELARLVERYECGVHFREDEEDNMVNFLLEIEADRGKLERLKENARKASFDFTPANACKYTEILKPKKNVQEVLETVY